MGVAIPGDQPRQRTKLADSAAESESPREIAVFITRHEGECAECKKAFFDGDLIRVEEQKALCLDCADLGNLEYLPRGNTALTRRATKYTSLRAVVLKWSNSRRRYERQGILATPQAICRAEEECAADADVRERQRVRAAAVREAGETGHVASVARKIRAPLPRRPREGGCPERRLDLQEMLRTRGPLRRGQGVGLPGAAPCGRRPYPARAHQVRHIAHEI